MDNQKRLPLLILVLSVLLFPAVAHANMVWPSLLIMERLYGWGIILVGLVIEIPVIRYITQSTLSRAVKNTVAINTGSAILGIVVIPLSGIVYALLGALLRMGTFHPVSIVLEMLFNALVTAAVELAILKAIYSLYLKEKLSLNRWNFLLFWLINVGSVGAAYATLLFKPFES